MAGTLFHRGNSDEFAQREQAGKVCESPAPGFGGWSLALASGGEESATFGCLLGVVAGEKLFIL